MRSTTSPLRGSSKHPTKQMATDLEIIGPVSIPFQKNGKGSAKHIGKAEVKAFWASKEAQGIADKQGCYVFALQAAKGFRP